MGIAPKECWKHFIRMDRDAFYKLLNELDAYIKPNPLFPNFRALSSETKLALTSLTFVMQYVKFLGQCTFVYQKIKVNCKELLVNSKQNLDYRKHLDALMGLILI
mgnify:CR=1 FL=1